MQLYILIRSLFPGALGYLWWVAPFCKWCGETVDRDIFPPSPPLHLPPPPPPPQTLLLLLFFPHCTLSCRQDQKSSNQRGKNVRYIVETLPWEVRPGRSAHPLVPLQDLLAFIVVVLRLGFPSPYFRPLKTVIFCTAVTSAFSVINGTSWGWCTIPRLKQWPEDMVSS